MKKTYITWHYTTHGVAYLKHILSKFYLYGKIPKETILFENLEQEELNLVFNNPNGKGFLFDEIVYITAPQQAFDELSSRRFSYKKTILEDKWIIANDLKNIYTEIIDNDEICYDIDKGFRYVEEKQPEKLELFKQSIWRNIQHYPISEQIKWLMQYSNFKNVYAQKFKVIELPIDSLRNEKSISDEVQKWIKGYFSKQKESQNIINVSLGSNETQVVWHILAEANQLPENTRFIKTYDDKSDLLNERFKRFSIKESPINLISSISSRFSIYTEAKSTFRKLADMKIEIFLKSGFSILLLGERGIGKTQSAELGRKKCGMNFTTFKDANCAAFDGNDNKAEAELFGVEKGAFTGVLPRNGLMLEANGGILFLDEFHYLSKLVQAKLMKALSTDKDNFMTITKLGSNKPTKIKLQMIFATNKSIKELKELLLPDFYDRVVQHVVNIPPLRDTPDDRVTDWKNVWEGLKFVGHPAVPNEPELIEWLKVLPLFGNYRDLQKIAMYYNVFSQFDNNTKEMLPEKTAFQYAKNEFQKYHSPVNQPENEKFNFNTAKTTKEMIADYCFELQQWSVKKFNGRKLAIEHFKSLGDTITEKTLDNWKNRKSIKAKIDSSSKKPLH